MDVNLDINVIKKILPQRYPFLMVDKLIQLEDFKSCTTVKCVTFNEPQFQGHFPDEPIMPGVLLIEAMAQSAALMFLYPTARDTNFKNFDKASVYLVSVDETKFRKPVVPGDVVYIKSEIIQSRKNLAKFKVKVYVDEKEVCSSIIKAILKGI